MKKAVACLLVLIVLISFSQFDSTVQAQDEVIAPKLLPVHGEWVLAIRSQHELKSMEEVLQFWALTDSGLVTNMEYLLSTQQADGSYLTLVQYNDKQRSSLTRTTSKTLFSLKGFERIEANKKYVGPDPREGVLAEVDDPKFAEQTHHTIMQSMKAWDMNMGRSEIIVAVTDDGVDYMHEDLKDNIWVNEDEIADNGIDDDNNGYIDDVYGYDIDSDDADPNQSEGTSHGTHVAGIVAAKANNGIGVAGTAPNVKVMPIKFCCDTEWTATDAAKAYKYAADNGAKIITTSFYIDGFVKDMVFEQGLLYAYNKGVLHFNSAGNGYATNPARQAFGELVLVGSTNAAKDAVDVVSDFSNRGTGVDIFAPGEEILSTVPGNEYEFMSGTSMASPNAAAVAALIWSANPDYNREQVLATLLASGEDVSALNKNILKEYLGSGRINSNKALSEKVSERVYITEISELKSSTMLKSLSTLTLRIGSRVIVSSESASNIENYSLVRISDNQKIDMKFVKAYKTSANQIELMFNVLEDGEYSLKVDNLKDPFGVSMIGNKEFKFSIKK